MLVLHHHLQKAANLLTLLAQVGIQQRLVTFAAAPQHIVFAAELVGSVHGGHYLRGRPGKHLRIGVGRRSGAVARVGKAVGGTPQQFHAGLLLFLCQHFGHHGEIVQIFFQRRAFWRDVDIVEAVIRHVELVEKFKRHVRFAFGHFQRIARGLPGTLKRTGAKHIRAIPAEVMPITGGKTQMLCHAFSQHDFIRIIVAKRQRIIGFGSGKANAINLVEIGLHDELRN